jgi:hypothetical protein
VIEGGKEMTAAQTTIPFKGANRLSGPLAIVAAGLIVAVVGVAISARPVAAPASVASVNSAPLTLGHDEHAAGVNSAPLTLGHDEHAAGGYSIPLTSGHDEHGPSQFPIAPLAPRMGGGSRPS